MDEGLLRLGVVFAGFGLAYGAKRLGWVPATFGTVLLKFGLYITIPALIFVSVAQVGVTRELVIFPVLSLVIVVVTFWVMRLVVRGVRLNKRREGTFRVAPLVMSSGFVLPFLVALYGGDGATRVALFNVGYNPVLLLGVYGLAASYSPLHESKLAAIGRVFLLPPLWALVAGVLVNLGHLQVSETVMQPLEIVGGLTLFVMIAALGLLFAPRPVRLDATTAIVGLRMGLGLAVGAAVVFALGLQGIDRAAVLALAAAPVGFNLLVFAAAEKLDQDLAARVVSLSMAIGLVVTPLILLLAR